jgi:cell division protein FtsA
LSQALEQAERIVGVPIERAWVGMSGTHITSQQNRGVVAVARSNGEIASEDVLRVVESAKMITPPLNYEMIHVLPRRFTVDGQIGIKDPVGMTGIRLEVDTQIIHGLTTHIKNMTKAVYRTGIEIDDLVLSILATGAMVTTARQKDLGVAVVNIGSTVTSLIVYEEGEVLHLATIPIGSENITNDLAIGLRTSLDVAEMVKINYGDAVASHVSKKEKIDLATMGAEKSEDVSRYFVAQIIEARMTEILEKVDEELINIHRKGMLPAGVILTGGGAKLDDIIDCAKNTLGLPASLGFPIDIKSVSDKTNDLAFATAIGLVFWGAGMEASGNSTPSRNKGLFKVTFIRKAVEQVQRFFKSLIP